MATVRQSITALYEESQKSAVEGAPMLAVLQSESVNAGTDSLTITEDAFTTSPPPAIAGRFDELRRLAELEATPQMAPLMSEPVTLISSDHNPFGDVAADDAGVGAPANAPASGRADEVADELNGIDLTAAFDPVPTVTPDTVSRDDTVEENVSATEQAAPEEVSIIEIPTTGFGAVPEPEAETPAPDSHPTKAVLPDEPPAPAASESLGDLDIDDIQDLVRQAWEDETAIGDAGRNTESERAPATGDIEMAMEEIAAAVVQSADTGPAVDVEAMKQEIITAMRTELQAVVESDLRSIVKAAVSEAMAEMPATMSATMATESPAPKAKKAPARKAAAKKTSSKATTAKKAVGKVVPKTITKDDNDDS